MSNDEELDYDIEEVIEAMSESHTDELAFLDVVFGKAKDRADAEGEEDLNEAAIDEVPKAK